MFITTGHSETIHYFTYSGLKIKSPGPDIHTYIDSTVYNWESSLECPQGYKLFWEYGDKNMHLDKVYNCSDSSHIPAVQFFETYSKSNDSATAVFIQNNFSVKEYVTTIDLQNTPEEWYAIYLKRTGRDTVKTDSTQPQTSTPPPTAPKSPQKEHCKGSYCGGYGSVRLGYHGTDVGLHVLYENMAFEFNVLLESNETVEILTSPITNGTSLAQYKIGYRFGFDKQFIIPQIGMVHGAYRKSDSEQTTFTGAIVELDAVIHYIGYLSLYASGIISTEGYFATAGASFGFGHIFTRK